jgi:hypothetical protein
VISHYLIYRFIGVQELVLIPFSGAIISGFKPLFIATHTLLIQKSITLHAATDTVTIGDLVVPATPLFIITNQSTKVGMDPFSGIQGGLLDIDSRFDSIY